MKSFSTLTVLGQARRLRLLALNALKSYDLDVARLRLITNDFNGIFRMDTTDGHKFVLRVTLPEGGHDLDHVTASDTEITFQFFTRGGEWIDFYTPTNFR